MKISTATRVSCLAALAGAFGFPLSTLAQNTNFPLLGSSRAQSYTAAFCASRPDTAVLPQDPRTLIRPGVNAGRNVAFNVYWEDCHAPSNNPWAAPKTCGEWRANAAEGWNLIYGDGNAGGTTIKFGHDNIGIVPAALWNQLWTRWGGYLWRPADFDQQVLDRYGLVKVPWSNPYPLPGEDPNRTDGGSGQLPSGVRQTKTSDGRWTGTLSLNCGVCHAGDLALPGSNGQARYYSGLGGKRADLQLLVGDLAIPAIPIGINTNAGVNNAFGIAAGLFGFLLLDTLNLDASSVAKGLAMQLGYTSGGGDLKSPVWWNTTRKARKFWDGGISTDSARMLPLGASVWVITDPDVAGTMDKQGWPMMAWLQTLQSPAYPGPIDMALAERGAVLFHEHDLWADGSNSDKPRPPSNGSCSGCHGAYSPRYVNDPNWLEDSRLEGMTGYVAPLEQIQTDKSRVAAYNPVVLDAMSSTVFSYPEGSPGYVPPKQKSIAQEDADDWKVFTGDRVKGACSWQGDKPGEPQGYAAPPLHGIWATGPYLHNASVPTLWALLKSSQRPAIWQRKLAGPSGVTSSYSVDFNAAYDTTQIGWKYSALNCGSNGPGLPFLTCAPQPTPQIADTIKFLTSLAPSTTFFGYQIIPPLTPGMIAERKVHNSYLYGKDNGGHTFARGLTDDERLAIIEYLKTL